MSKQGHKKTNTPIVVAWIGFAGLIIAAIIGVFNYDLTPKNDSVNDSSSSSYEIIGGSIVTFESDHLSENDIETEENDTIYDENYKGMLQKYDNSSGIAYIFKNHLEEYPIGSICDNSTIIGWSIDIFAGENSVLIYVGRTLNSDEFNCGATYYENGEYMGEYKGNIAVKLTENGDLKIKFNFDDTYFDFCNADAIYVLRRLG